MDYSDFKRLLGADPLSQDPEVERASRSGPEYRQLAEQARAFERKLQAAMRLPVDEQFIDGLATIGHNPGRLLPTRRWLALAASVVLVAGSLSIAWLQSRQPQEIGQYLQRHYAHDGAELEGRAGPGADPGEIERILAGFGVSGAPELTDRVRLIKYCPTPDGKGAHMVLAADTGPVHLIYMPETAVTDGQEMAFDGAHARLVSLPTGSAAIIGGGDQPLEGVAQMVRSSIRALPAQT